jgi:hypothetical protein
MISRRTARPLKIVLYISVPKGQHRLPSLEVGLEHGGQPMGYHHHDAPIP